MLLPIKPICSKSKIRKDGTSIIFLQYCGPDDKKTLLNTEIGIPPQFWTKRSQSISDDLPDMYGEAAKLNERLTALLRKAEDIIKLGMNSCVSDIVDFVKIKFDTNLDVAAIGNEKSGSYFNPANETRADSGKEGKSVTELNISGKSCVDFYSQFNDYMKVKKNKVSPGMMKIYEATKEMLLSFDTFRGKTISFESLDYDYYDRLVDFLTYDYEQRRRKVVVKGLKRSTIGRTIKQLRIFVRDRVKRKIISPIDLSDFKIVDEEADAIYLTPAEIDCIYATDLLLHPTLALHRDLLVLGCLTGLRFSDFSSITPEDINGDMLYKKQRKSDGWVVIPLRPRAYAILVTKFKGLIPKTTNPEFNRHIKNVGKLAGITGIVKFSHKKGNQDLILKKSKCDWITSHTCRRSFCTNEYLAGTPVELIMKISGHKSLKDFYKYIRITPEEAGNRIKELWKKRDINMQSDQASNIAIN